MQIVGVLLLLGAIGWSEALTACLDTWVPFQGSCYLFSHANLTFNQASIHCLSHDAHLVYIETAAENKFLESFSGNMNGYGFWIGLTEDVDAGEWTWQGTGEVPEFTDWAPDEPNSSAENCAMLYPSKDNHWNDLRCGRYLEGFICETEGEEFPGDIVG